MPDIIELNELLTGLQDIIDNEASWRSPYAELSELMSATWIRAWLDDLFDLKDELVNAGDWAAAKALDEILDQTWIDAWYG